MLNSSTNRHWTKPYKQNFATLILSNLIGAWRKTTQTIALKRQVPTYLFVHTHKNMYIGTYLLV